jgi:hypothetical protein
VTGLPWPSLGQRLSFLEDMIFAAVCEGIDATVLIARRDKLAWELENGDHT